MELSASNILGKPISPFCVPRNVILLFTSRWVTLSQRFLRNYMNGARKNKKMQILIQIGHYSNAVMCWRKRNKRKEIKMVRLREKRISKVLNERKKNGTILDNSRHFTLSNIWNTRSRVTLSERISLITTQKVRLHWSRSRIWFCIKYKELRTH